MPLMPKLVAAVLLLSSCMAYAQTPYPDDAVFQGLGGKQGIKQIVETFFGIVLADVRIKDSFESADILQSKARIAEQFCELSGGPCQFAGKYKGRDMKSVHEDFKLTNAHFNALTEDLQIAMERNHIPTSISNKLIAKLAPMQRDIVTK
jgi:truncated hemoglobin YjbI